MAEMRANGTKTERGESRDGGEEANPAVRARRELVEWCKAHNLPVPADPRRPR